MAYNGFDWAKLTESIMKGGAEIAKVFVKPEEKEKVVVAPTPPPAPAVDYTKWILIGGGALLTITAVILLARK